jgi:hypothetical protein
LVTDFNAAIPVVHDRLLSGCPAYCLSQAIRGLHTIAQSCTCATHNPSPKVVTEKALARTTLANSNWTSKYAFAASKGVCGGSMQSQPLAAALRRRDAALGFVINPVATAM